MKAPFDYESAKKDTVPSKTQPGDYVIPVEIQNQNRGLLAQAKKAVADAGADAEAYVAASTHGNYNPMTGDQQFFLKKLVKKAKKVVKKVASGVKKVVKKAWNNPIIRTAAIGAGVFFGGPLAMSALGKVGIGAGIAAKGAAASAAAGAAGAGKIAATAAWWKGAAGIGAAAAKGASSLGSLGGSVLPGAGGGGFASMAAGGASKAGMAGWGSGIGTMASTAGTTTLGAGSVPMFLKGGSFAGAAAAGGKGLLTAGNALRAANAANNFMPQGGSQGGFGGTDLYQNQNQGSGFWNAAGNIWGGMDGASRAALITGGFGAAGGWAEAKMDAKVREDDRKHEMNMERHKTDVERENFDDRNRIMGMGRDGQGGVSVDPNMVKNWGLGDMSLPRRTYDNFPPPNTPMSDKLRAGFLAGA